MATKYLDTNNQQKQELKELTSCCICTDIYKCPKLLPCGHTFCMNCLQQTGLNTSKQPGDKMPCPICRQQFTIPSEGFTGLQNDHCVESWIRVAQILDPSMAASFACDVCLEENPEEAGKEVPRADMYCNDCKKMLCEECWKHHRKLKLTKNHKLLPINGETLTGKNPIQNVVPIVCDIHKQEDLRIYCCLCKTAVCDFCFIEHHEGHKGTYVTEAAVEFRKEIANNIERVETCITQAEVKKSEIEKWKRDVDDKLVKLEFDIITRKDGLKQLADNYESSQLKYLYSIRQSILKEVTIETGNIDAQLARLKTYISSCNTILTKGSDFDICRSVDDLSGIMNELQSENQSLIERQLKPLTLYFEEGDEGQLKVSEQDHSKYRIKTTQFLMEELKKRKQELEFEKLFNETLETDIDEPAKPTQKMSTTVLQVNADKLVTKGEPNSTNSSALQKSSTNDAENDRICALMLLPSVDIDEDIFQYLVRCRNHELSRITDKCNLHEPYKVGREHRLAFEVKPQYDTESVIADFRELCGKTTTNRVNIPEGIDREGLKSLAEAMAAEFKDVELSFMSQERVYKIVGSHREMTRAKEMLTDVIAFNSPTSHGFETTTDKKVLLNVPITPPPTDKKPSRNVQWYTASAASNFSQARGYVFTALDQSHYSLQLSTSNSLTIEVKHCDLTRIPDVDVVVSCVTRQLDIDGPLAEHIIKAAGPSVMKELVDRKYRMSMYRNGQPIRTSAGNLNRVKAIIHVVCPQKRSRDALRNVFTECLRYINEKLKFSSACLPPIGYDLYGAQMFVDSFLDAVESFASTLENGNPFQAYQLRPHYLSHIQLVGNELHCIEQLKQCINQRLGAK